MVGRGLEAAKQELERAGALRREKGREHRRPEDQGSKNDEDGQSVRFLLPLAADGKSVTKLRVPAHRAADLLAQRHPMWRLRR